MPGRRPRSPRDLDLAVDTPSHLNVDSLGFRTAPGTPGLSDVQQRENAVSERLVSQFLAPTWW